jgi:hypothetical protein
VYLAFPLSKGSLPTQIFGRTTLKCLMASNLFLLKARKVQPTFFSFSAEKISRESLKQTVITIQHSKRHVFSLFSLTVVALASLTFGITTFGITTLSILAISLTTFGYITPSRVATLTMIILSIMILSIATLSIMSHIIATHSTMSRTQLNNT